MITERICDYIPHHKTLHQADLSLEFDYSLKRPFIPFWLQQPQGLQDKTLFMFASVLHIFRDKQRQEVQWPDLGAPFHPQHHIVPHLGGPAGIGRTRQPLGAPQMDQSCGRREGCCPIMPSGAHMLRWLEPAPPMNVIGSKRGQRSVLKLCSMWKHWILIQEKDVSNRCLTGSIKNIDKFSIASHVTRNRTWKSAVLQPILSLLSLKFKKL